MAEYRLKSGVGGWVSIPPRITRLEDAGEMAGYMLDLFAESETGSVAPTDVRTFFKHFHSRELDYVVLEEKLWYALRYGKGYTVGCGPRTVSWVIDRFLGIDTIETEKELAEQKEERKLEFPNESLWLGSPYWTDYHLLRAAIMGLNLSDEDKLYDLGAGYGRMPIYAGIVTEAKTEGIELVPERVSAATRAITQLGLKNATMTQANVLDHDFSDGTAFYMWQPFSYTTHLEVEGKLKEVAEDHPIQIAYKGDSRLSRLDWLNLVHTGDSGHLKFYESV